MFSDVPFLLALRRDIVPFLRTYPFAQIWQLGAGFEAYAHAIVLREEGLGARARLYVTDRDPEALARLAEGNLALGDMEREAIAYGESGGRASLDEYYVARGEHAIMRPLLREPMVLSEHDWNGDASFNEFQLIVAYQAIGARSPTVSALLDASLCRDGLLALAREDTLDLQRRGYQRVLLQKRVFRKSKGGAA